MLRGATMKPKEVSRRLRKTIVTPRCQHTTYGGRIQCDLPAGHWTWHGSGDMQHGRLEWPDEPPSKKRRK
jgi:hypothetical protein